MQVNRAAAVVLASQDLQSSGEGLPPSKQTLPFPADTMSVTVAIRWMTCEIQDEISEPLNMYRSVSRKLRDTQRD